LVFLSSSKNLSSKQTVIDVFGDIGLTPALSEGEGEVLLLRRKDLAAGRDKALA
jgi:hypothetical protein